MQTQGEIIRVGMAQFAWSRAPGVLMTSGLGSCVGVTMYDPVAQIGGLAHVMLPNSHQGRSAENRGKFADTAIPDLLQILKWEGARPERLIIKMAGGAQMFSFQGAEDRFSIGKRNAEAVHQVLKEAGLKVVSEDTGGNYGRTVIFNTLTGEVLIKTIEHGERRL